jgi:hypothetical protein
VQTLAQVVNIQVSSFAYSLALIFFEIGSSFEPASAIISFCM